MTKRHFNWAAEYVRTSPAEIREPLTHAFLNMFAEFGPNFDRDRFLVACKPVTKVAGKRLPTETTPCETVSQSGHPCTREFNHEGRCRY